MGLPSPYTPGDASFPAVLAGRDPELSLVRERLGHAATYSRWPGAPVVFHGARGVGKTVLLQQAARDAAAGGLLTTWANATPEVGFVGSLVSHLLEEVRAAGLDRQDRWKRWLNRVHHLSVELGATGAKVAADWSPPANSHDPMDLSRLLRDTVKLALESKRTGLAVMLDELQTAAPGEVHALGSSVKDLAREQLPVVIVADGLPNVVDRLTQEVTGSERYTYREIGVLDEAASYKALVDPATEIGVQWDPDAAQAVLRAARGYPHSIQLLGDHAWRAASPSDTSPLITAEAATWGISEATREMEMGLFRARWSKATGKQRDLMTALARLAGDGVASRAAVARELGRSSSSIGPVRAELLDRGVIAAQGHGQLQFTVPGFAAYVLRQSRDVTTATEGDPQ